MIHMKKKKILIDNKRKHWMNIEKHNITNLISFITSLIITINNNIDNECY